MAQTRPLIRCARILAVLFVANVLLAGTADAAEIIYVDHRGGNDRSNGAASVHIARGVGPVKTLQAAIRRVSPSGRIVVLSTALPRAEMLVIDGRRSLGTLRHPLVIEGNGAEIVGYDPIPVTDWQAVKGATFFRRRPPIAAGRLFSNDQLLTTAQQVSIVADVPKLAVGEYALWEGKFWFRPGGDHSLSPHALAATSRPGGIMFDRVSNVTLRGFRLRGFSVDAIQVKGPATNIRIEQCELTDNVRAGLSVFTNSEVQFVDSKVSGNGRAGLIVENYSHVRVRDIDLGSNANEQKVDATSTVKPQTETRTTPLE